MAGIGMTSDPSGLESLGVLADLSPELQMAVVSEQIPTIVDSSEGANYAAGLEYYREQVPIYSGTPPLIGPAGALTTPAAVTAVVQRAGQVAATVAPVVAGVAAGAGGLYALLQGLGLGAGGGIGGINVLGGDDIVQGGVEFGGPGLPEPPASQVVKEWHVDYSWGTLQYYLVQTGARSRKIFLYNTRTKKWKWWAWRPPHLAVIGKNMPSHKQITRLRRNLSRHAADAQTILKLTRPKALRQPRRRK